MSYLNERLPDTSIATQLVKALVSHTINDISYETMSRIVHRLNRMSQSDRNAPERVAFVLYEELGAEKSITYVEKAFANGMIKAKEYYALRGFLTFPKPREAVPPPLAGAGSRQLIESQKKLQEDFGKLNQAGKEALMKPFQNLNKDIERIKRAWGV